MTALVTSITILIVLLTGTSSTTIIIVIVVIVIITTIFWTWSLTQFLERLAPVIGIDKQAVHQQQGFAVQGAGALIAYGHLVVVVVLVVLVIVAAIFVGIRTPPVKLIDQTRGRRSIGNGRGAQSLNHDDTGRRRRRCCGQQQCRENESNP